MNRSDLPTEFYVDNTRKNYNLLVDLGFKPQGDFYEDFGYNKFLVNNMDNEVCLGSIKAGYFWETSKGNDDYLVMQEFGGDYFRGYKEGKLVEYKIEQERNKLYHVNLDEGVKGICVLAHSMQDALSKAIKNLPEGKGVHKAKIKLSAFGEDLIL